jgi:galactose mutarotase-like enzyme
MTKSEALKYIGNLSQLGCCRHYTLNEGLARGMRATDINTGSGLKYTVLPDRAMDISMAAYKANNLVYITCNGETHPSFFEADGSGWLRTFGGGLLTTCGLTYLGPPCNDENETLGLHGRISATPASQFADLSGWIDNNYILKVRGTMEEGYLSGKKLRMEREIYSILGENTIHLKDTITNFGNTPSPLTLLYHMNFGYPLLSEETELEIDPAETIPRDQEAAKGLNEFRKFIKPQPSFNEQVFFHSMKGNNKGEAIITIRNKIIRTSVAIKFNIRQLPYVSQWKMMAYGEYVLGIEPGNVHSKSRKVLREENTLPSLLPGESSVFDLEVTISDLQ